MARIQPIPPKEWPPEIREAIAAMRPANPRHEFPKTEGRPKALNALGTLAQHPDLARAFNTFNGHILFGSTLSPRQRELLVLRVAVAPRFGVRVGAAFRPCGRCRTRRGRGRANRGRARRRRGGRRSIGRCSRQPTS